MVYPKLVCYDKNQWKTLQQLSNWNREWSELLQGLWGVTEVQLNISCTWMDGDFAKTALEGVAKLPNIQKVLANFSSKNGEVGQILSAFEEAQIFTTFKQQFNKLG